MFDNSVIRPIAAAIGAAALVFVLAPGAAFAKVPDPGNQHSHHGHSQPSNSGAPLGPQLNRPAPPSRSSESSPVPTRAHDPISKVQAEIAELSAEAQDAVGVKRTVLLAQINSLEQTLALLLSGIVPPATPATPPTSPVPTRTPPVSPPVTPSATPTPSQPAQTPASIPAELANLPSGGPSLITIGASAAPRAQPDGLPQSGAGATPSSAVAPPVSPATTAPSGSPTPHEAGTQPIPGLSPQSTTLLFAIVAAFAVGILFLVLGAGYRGRRRA